MNRNEKIYQDIEFEDEQQIISSLKIVKAEYFRKAIRAFVFIVINLVIYMIYLILWFQPNIFLPRENILGVNSTIRRISFNFTTAWAFFSISIFIVSYLIKLIRMKFTPSLICFIKREITNIGFEFQKRYTSSLLFLMLNTGAIALLIYIDFGVIEFTNSLFSNFIQGMIVLYLILSIAIPIIWLLVNDKFIVKLKSNFYIVFNFHFRIRKKRGYDPNLVGISLSSNNLCSRFNKDGKRVHTKISEIRWLPRKGKTKIELNPYLQFHEFSCPINVQKQFLNITLAVNEWDFLHNNYYRRTNDSYLRNLKMRLLSSRSQMFSLRILG